MIDDRTDAATGLARLRDLDERRGLAAVVGVHSSATFDAVSRYAQASGLLYLYTAANEGSPVQNGTLFRLGESVADQLGEAVPALMRESGGRAWYLIGNDYLAAGRLRAGPPHRGAPRRARRRRAPRPARRIGLRRRAGGHRDSGADMCSPAWWGGVHRLRAAVPRRGAARPHPYARTLLEERDPRASGAAGSGVWSCLPNFSALDTAENADFLRRDPDRVRSLGALAVGADGSAYEGLHLSARAAAKPVGAAGAEVDASCRGSRWPAARQGSVGADGRLRQSMYLAEATATGGSAVRAQMPSGTAGPAGGPFGTAGPARTRSDVQGRSDRARVLYSLIRYSLIRRPRSPSGTA